jgi:hypothetical protein
MDVMRWRSERLTEPIGQLLSLSAAGALTSELPILAASYLHMHVNRMLQSDHRQQEMVIYDLLLRYYRSVWGRSRQERIASCV